MSITSLSKPTCVCVCPRARACVRACVYAYAWVYSGLQRSCNAGSQSAGRMRTHAIGASMRSA